MSETVPTWLKAKQNGALGEARAKAFLMDRFWILERSVDVDGVDLIIQRRLTNQNLLDRTPPRLGFVQVKFFQSSETTQYIPKAYILDNNGNSREDFFVLCHSGSEENAKVYFLTPEMVITDFEIAIIDSVEKYRVNGKQLLTSEKYLVKLNSATLARIERSLQWADFKRNREFISWKLPNVVSDPSAILPDYHENIENSWGNIPEEFQRIKEKTIAAMKDLEKTYLELKEIAEEIDPVEAFSKIEDLYINHGRGEFYGNWGRELMNDLYDEDLYYRSKEHIEKVENLRSDGLLDEYTKMKTSLVKQVVSYLVPFFPIGSNTVHTIRIKYSIEWFKILTIKQGMHNASSFFNVSEELNKFGHVEIPNQNNRGIKELTDNTFEFYWLAGRWHIDEKDKRNPEAFYEKIAFSFYMDILDKIYDLKYRS